MQLMTASFVRRGDIVGLDSNSTMYYYVKGVTAHTGYVVLHLMREGVDLDWYTRNDQTCELISRMEDWVKNYQTEPAGI